MASFHFIFNFILARFYLAMTGFHLSCYMLWLLVWLGVLIAVYFILMRLLPSNQNTYLFSRYF